MYFLSQVSARNASKLSCARRWQGNSRPRNYSGYLAFFAPEHNGWRGTSTPACIGHADRGRESSRNGGRTTEIQAIHHGF
jgi:hypothetical protein